MASEGAGLVSHLRPAHGGVLATLRCANISNQIWKRCAIPPSPYPSPLTQRPCTQPQILPALPRPSQARPGHHTTPPHPPRPNPPHLTHSPHYTLRRHVAHDPAKPHPDTTRPDSTNRSQIWLHHIRSNPIQSNPIRSDPVRSGGIRSNPIQSEPIRSDLLHISPHPRAARHLRPVHV